MSKKIDKSLLPQPQKPVGWKRGVLQITTDSKADLNSSSIQLPVTTKYGTSKNNPFSNNQTQQQSQAVIKGVQPQNTPKSYQGNSQSRQSIQNKPQMGMTASQYSLEQKQLLTFAANQSNEDEEENDQDSKYQTVKKADGNVQSIEKRRKNRFENSNQSHQSVNNENSRNDQSSSVQQSQHTQVNRSSSKNKQHKCIVYRHNLPQPQQFVSYCIVTKQSKSGMFSNQKLLTLNSFKRQLVYYSKLPKLLPFASFGQMQRKYLCEEKPKEVIELDKVRRFMFVPAKGSLASVVVGYVNEKGERREWKLGMGNNAQMNEWIQLVNQVYKKEHYSVVKSQVKYPPKPKKQPQNKSNHYETKFTKTLKQQVLPIIKESSIKTSRGNESQLNQSQLSVSGIRSGKNEMIKSREKQYVVDKSKFVNTKSYIIDLEDVSGEDIVYVPEVGVKEEEVPKGQTLQQSQLNSISDNNNNNHQNSQKSINSKYWQVLNQQSNGNSRFSHHLQQRQRQINNQHKNRVTTYIKDVIDNHKQQQQQQQYNQRNIGVGQQTVAQAVVLSRKLSGERLSQTTHKDLNIHIDSRVAFGEDQRQKELGEEGYGNNQEIGNVANSHIYEPFSRVTANNQQQSRTVESNNNNNRNIISSINPKNIVQPKSIPFYPQPQQSRKRVYTQLQQKHYQQNQRPMNQYFHNIQHQKQWHKLTFTNNNNNTHSDSLQSSSSSHYQPPTTKPTNTKDKYRLQQPPSKNSRTRNNNHHISNSYATDNNSQIEDIIVGGKLHDGYILNFSPYGFGNNWFRLWLETEPGNRVDVYAAFVRTARALVKRVLDTPQQFANCHTLQKNNTHILFSLQHMTLKLPFKLPLPHGLGQFISVLDFTRSQDFLSQVFKYETQLVDQYQNYQYILSKLSNEFNSGVLSMPIYFPMCCLVTYKGISVLCKASWEGANLGVERVGAEEVGRFDKELEYVEERCLVRFGTKTFDLYSIHIPSFSKTIIYMDNLTRFLPLMPNPLHKNPTPTMQLPGSYINENIKKGIISSGKDIQQIEKHLVGNVIKRYGEVVVERGRLAVGAGELREVLCGKGGLREEYLGLVYRRVEEREHKVIAKSLHASSLILTQILITQYSKACQLYFMKEHFKQLYTCISSQPTKHTNNQTNNNNNLTTSQASHNSKTIKNLPSYTTVTNKLGHSFSEVILQILHYLIYRNSKVWTVLSVALEEKYGIGEFRKMGSQRQAVDALMGRVSVEYLVLGLVDRLGVEVGVREWVKGMTWGTLPLTQDNLNLTPYVKSYCYPLSLFNPQYSSLISQLQQISTTSSFSSTLTEKNYFAVILQILNLSQETHQNQSVIIKSAPYELLQFGFTQERQLIDLALSYFIPTNLKDTQSTKHINNKQKAIQLYQNLLNQQQVRTSKDVSINTFQVNLNGIKWLIKQNQYQLAQVLIQEQLQAISIWYTQSLLQMKCKFLDLAATFYHKKLGNRNNLAIEYAMSSLQLAMDNKLTLPLSTCAEKCFQAANIHYDCGLIQKSLELYELAEEFVFQSQRNKALDQTDLSIQFLKIYLRKAQIKLAMGRKNQTLYECLECLRKCEQFEDLLNLGQTLTGQEYIRGEKDQQQLNQLQMNVFQLIFRTYQVTKNLKDMQRIAQLCCTKFVEDKILKMAKNLRNHTLEDSVNPSIMSKLLKMCWKSIINKITTCQINSPNQPEQSLSKTMTIPSSLTRKSFCLSGTLSQPKKPPQLNHYQRLQQLMEKLQALCKLYPKSRYDRETLSMFVCREVVEASGRMNVGKGMGRGEYQLIGGRRKGVSGRVEQMIGDKEEGEAEVGSVLFDRLWEVVKELMDNNNSNGSRSSRKIQRYQTESSPYYQRRGSRSKPHHRFQPIQPPTHPITSIKKQKFYHSPQAFTHQFDHQSQDQSQLRMSYILGRQEERSRNDNISTYDIYSLKDQMDRKYMLMEALFGLCGRDFVLGGIMEAVDGERRKVNGLQNMKVFYE